jgi:hypothetical protein
MHLKSSDWPFPLKLSFGGKHRFQTSGYHSGARDAHVLCEGIRSREKTPFHRHGDYFRTLALTRAAGSLTSLLPQSSCPRGKGFEFVGHHFTSEFRGRGPKFISRHSYERLGFVLCRFRHFRLLRNLCFSAPVNGRA